MRGRAKGLGWAVLPRLHLPNREPALLCIPHGWALFSGSAGGFIGDFLPAKQGLLAARPPPLLWPAGWQRDERRRPATVPGEMGCRKARPCLITWIILCGWRSLKGSFPVTMA